MLFAYKPVLVNSSHVLQADSGGFAQTLLDAKVTFSRVSVSGSPLASVVGAAEPLAQDAAVAMEEELLVATVELLGVDSASMPFSIALPPSVKQTTVSAVQGIFARLQGLASSVSEVRRWE